MLWACLIFPTLPLDVFARALAPADAARRIVIASGGHHPRVVAASRAARACGIRHDQTISGALALAPDIVLRDRDAAAESEALTQIATWACTFTPMVSLAPPNAVLAEISGSLRLFGGLPRLAAYLVDGVRAMGYRMRAAIAPTPGAALLLARAGGTLPLANSLPPQHASPHLQDTSRHHLLDIAQLPAALACLSLALCDIEEGTRTTLGQAGITTFGQLAALPRDGLARRFGADVVAFTDQALGLANDPRPPFVPAPRFSSRLDLPVPVHEVEALTFAVNRLLHTFCTWLTARGLGVTRFTLLLAHERYIRQRGLAATQVQISLGAPARTAAHLLGVSRERLARIELPAPVETLTLTSDETAPLAGRNFCLLPGDEAAAADVPLLDRLRARLGEDAVTCVAPYAEHRPECALHTAPADAHRTAGNPPATATSSRRRAKTPPPLPLPEAPRPVWLLAQAQPLQMSESRPWVLQDGPERIESGWWDGTDVRRDYFVARSPQGELMWIYRDHRYGTDDGEWFVHGVFA